MKLYCVKLFKGDTIVQVDHILGNNNKEIYNRLDITLKEIEKYCPDYANNYCFSEVQNVDNFEIHKLFENYEIVKGKIILKR